MLKHTTLVAAVLLLAAAPGVASVQFRAAAGWLGEGDWQLREEKGELYLVKAPYRERERVSHSWSVSNPTIKAKGGKLLGYDAKGRDAEPRLVEMAGNGTSTRWSFEEVAHLSPKANKHERRLKEGASGMTFRLRAAEGPYKGWYLATKAGKGGKRALVPVRAKKDAAVFKYIATYYYIGP